MMLASAIFSILAVPCLIPFQTVRADGDFVVLNLPFLPRPPLRMIDDQPKSNSAPPLVVIPPYTITEATSFKSLQTSSLQTSSTSSSYPVTQPQTTQSISRSSTSRSRTGVSSSVESTVISSPSSIRTSNTSPAPYKSTYSHSTSKSTSTVSHPAESTSISSNPNGETHTLSGSSKSTSKLPFSPPLTISTTARSVSSLSSKSGGNYTGTPRPSTIGAQSERTTSSCSSNCSTMPSLTSIISTTIVASTIVAGSTTSSNHVIPASQSKPTYPISYKTVTIPAATVTIEGSSALGYPITYQTVTTMAEVTVTVSPSSSRPRSTSGQTSTDLVSVNSASPSETSSDQTATQVTVTISGLNPGVHPAATTPVPVAESHNGVVAWRPPSFFGALVALLAGVFAF